MPVFTYDILLYSGTDSGGTDSVIQKFWVWYLSKYGVDLGLIDHEISIIGDSSSSESDMVLMIWKSLWTSMASPLYVYSSYSQVTMDVSEVL